MLLRKRLVSLLNSAIACGSVFIGPLKVSLTMKLVAVNYPFRKKATDLPLVGKS
jgi:hypothetical protein